MNDIIKINNHDILIKEYKGQRVVTFKDIDVVHGRPEGTAKRNFNDNKKHFIEGEDFFTISYSEFCTEYVPNPPKRGNPNIPVNLMTESGYLMLVKSFTDDLAWKVQRQLVSSYFRVRQLVDERLSPETKMLFQMINQIAITELQAKEAKELAQKAIVTTENIKDAVKPILDNWREEINTKFNRIQKSCGTEFNVLRNEMYSELERRAGCDLGTRLRNKKQRMSDSGCTKTKIKNINRMDIIDGDEKFSPKLFQNMRLNIAHKDNNKCNYILIIQKDI